MKDSQKGKKQISILLRAYKFAGPFVKLFILTIFLNTIFSILTALSLTIIKPVVEIITNSKISLIPQTDTSFLENLKNSFFNFVYGWVINSQSTTATLINLSILIISIFILKNIFKYAGSISTVYLEEGLVKHIRDIVFSKLTSLSVGFFNKRKSGSIISILTNDVAVVNSTIIKVITDLIREIIQVLIYIFLLIAVSFELTLIAFSTSIVSLILLRFGMKFLRRYASRMQNAMADFTSILQETLAGIRVVKGYNAENETNRRFFAHTSKYVHSAVKYQKIISLIPSINEVFAILALCVVFFVGGSKVLAGTMRGDDLMLFLFSLFAIMAPIAAIVHNISQYQRGFVAAERVFDILDQKTTVETGTREIETFEKEITINNVNFSYHTTEVIKNANFNISKTKKIAFVGASGSGKSTMLDLLIRFYDPNSGNISIDGTNIRDFKLESYRSLFGIVSQENMLFNDSIANNIRFGRNDAPMEDIIESARIANAHDFISKLPDGYDTVIGDRGIMLSGGERQRIAIARALIRNPYILIFDEATSALDAESEKVVQEAITVSLKERTAVLVAHRLSTITGCDEILVFDNGQIAERGSHQQLLAQKGVYKKLYDIQFSNEG